MAGIAKYTSGFETDLDGWATGGDRLITDDDGWTIDDDPDSTYQPFVRWSGSTPSENTGPSGAAVGSYYVYAEMTEPVTKVEFHK